MLPYGRETVACAIPDSRFSGEYNSGLHSWKPEKSQTELVMDALANPHGRRLGELAAGKKKITIIASDHTRPVPSKIIIPPMLDEIRKSSSAEITILVATGCHRQTSKDELIEKFGPEIFNNEKITVHDCDSPDMANLGKLPSGGDLILNRLAVETDLLISEGFIEPHFFAGFSGGPKSVLPGVAGRNTVLYNHNAGFIAHPCSRTGVTEGNPVQTDMVYAAKKAGLSFICNVVLNNAKETVFAAAGAFETAHNAGIKFLTDKCGIKPVLSDIVITTNGGHPLDRNIYQAVKGMTAAESAVRKNGVIIMLAKSGDGHGAPEFYKTFLEEKNLDRMLRTFEKTPSEATRIDQWQSQIFARVLKHAKVIYVSEAPDEMVRGFQMIPARTVAEAVKTADEILGNPDAKIAVIPDGVSVVVN